MKKKIIKTAAMLRILFLGFIINSNNKCACTRVITFCPIIYTCKKKKYERNHWKEQRLLSKDKMYKITLECSTRGLDRNLLRWNKTIIMNVYGTLGVSNLYVATRLRY